MIKKSVLLLLLLIILVFSVSCGNKPENHASVITETPLVTTIPPHETEANPAEETDYTEDFGSSFIIPASSVRPVAVMIDNQGDKVLPQGGISQAQIVYEILVEYNITRFIAFFWDTLPEMIGPVRSSRHYFLDYAMEYDAVYTHAGGIPYAKSDIKNLKIQNIDYLVHGDAFWDLTNDPRNWQDSYTSKELLTKKISNLKYRTEPNKQFPFEYNNEFTVPESDQNAESISIKYISNSNVCGFIFDSETKLYARTRMGKPHIERNTEKQVMAANIIIQDIPSPLIPGDKEGRRNLKNIGSGKGLYITGGKAIPIKWSKEARDMQTKYTTEDGKPLTLNKGQTWIEIVPGLDYVKIE